MTESWAAANGAQINKKKCGLMKVTKKETSIIRRDLEGVPFLHEYKYLGVPLDQSFTLKHLVRLIKEKLKPFITRINLLPHSIVGWGTKLNLWSCYARCHFDYFAGAIALCGQANKFERMYTKSLKRALNFPLQMPNTPLLQALGVPSLLQIASHHILNNADSIGKRFSDHPESLRVLAAELAPHGDEYARLQMPPPITETGENEFKMDLLADKKYLDRCFVGIVVGSFLTIRTSSSGRIRDCPRCKTPATQEHFLDSCPVNAVPRETLLSSVPLHVVVEQLQFKRLSVFYREVRSLTITVRRDLGAKTDSPENVYAKLAITASSLASQLTGNVLSMFGEEDRTASQEPADG